MEKLINGINDLHNYRVRIPFSRQHVENIVDVEVNINNWNEACAKAIEMFGLPGGSYTCRFTEKAIEFWFLEEKDAMVFELCCG